MSDVFRVAFRPTAMVFATEAEARRYMESLPADGPYWGTAVMERLYRGDTGRHRRERLGLKRVSL